MKVEILGNPISPDCKRQQDKNEKNKEKQDEAHETLGKPYRS